MQLIKRPFKIIENHKIINLVVALSLDIPAPGYLKRQITEKEDIPLTGIACCSLRQLKILSMALELMSSLLILLSRLQIYFLLITLKYRLMYTTKGGRHSQRQMASWLPRSPVLIVRFLITIKSPQKLQSTEVQRSLQKSLMYSLQKR